MTTEAGAYLLGHGMPWAQIKHSAAEVDAAGLALINEGAVNTLEEFAARERAIDVINNWRSSSAYPLNAMHVVLRQRARRMFRRYLTSQRTKRLAAIQLKLKRMRALTLSEMQDVGGCRVILPSVADVKRLVDLYETVPVLHTLDHKDDYIVHPKKSGYRSVHLIYRYKASGRRGTHYNGRKIEIQFRSDLQHLWATAVETAGTFQRQWLKSSRGDPRWLRFFALTGSAFALRENSPPVPRTPADRSTLVAELKCLAQDLQVERKLEAYGQALTRSEQLRKKSRHFVLELMPGEAQSTVSVRGFRAGQRQEATDDLVETERRILHLPGAEAVLVSAESIDAVLRGYPSYFLDTKRFLTALRHELIEP